MDQTPQYLVLIEELLSEIHQLIEVLQKSDSFDHFTPEIHKEINKLSEISELVCEMCDEVAVENSVDAHAFEQQVLESPEVRSSDKQIIKQAKDIQIKGKVIASALEEVEKQNPRKSPSKKRRIGGKEKERQKMFKTIGGDQTWIPL